MVLCVGQGRHGRRAVLRRAYGPLTIFVCIEQGPKEIPTHEVCRLIRGILYGWQTSRLSLISEPASVFCLWQRYVTAAHAVDA